MSVKIKDIAPGEIERESFRIIEREIGPTAFSPDEFAVVRRMIHASGDFEFARTVRFYPGAVEAGLRAILSGRDILVDVNMAFQGVSRRILQKFGGRLHCHIRDERAAELAQKEGITRAEAGIELAVEEPIGIVAIGNAPTALIRTIRMMREVRFRPDLIIGVPVGFVNARESKELLRKLDRPWITTLGRKGGTAIAVAAVNAILRLCEERKGK
jgi:precorrin-8X/cobalt-precorrin-8 methylmutase